MKQEIETQNKATTLSNSPTTPSRFRPSKTKDNPRSGVSPGLKTRPKSFPQETINSLRAKKPVGLNKLKSGEEVVAQKGKEMEETRLVGRPEIRSRAAEQYARPRRGLVPNFKRIEEDPDGKRKELQQRLDVSESLVQELQSEIFVLKNQLEKLRSLNVELESQNRQIAEDLAAAEAKISETGNHEQRESVADEAQIPGFKDVQKLIANKLEHLKAKNETMKEDRTITVQSAVPLKPLESAAALKPVTRSAEIQPRVSMNPPPLPPPPPPPLPLRQAPVKASTMQKAPTLVEFYHSLTKRNGKKDSPGTGNCNNPVVNAHSSIVGEIQNRSTHLLAIKADVETKGDFIKFLIQKVQTAAYTDIEDVLTFIDWLDTELSSLADERAVLKHFNWPERKADAMREAAFEYRDLKRLEIEVSSYKDDAYMPCEASLKKMASLLDKSERSIHRLIKLRDLTIPSYRDCKIPTEWMLDSGMVSKIKLASVKLAKMYMKRVSMEVESIRQSERESTQEALLLQGVRFAYRAHQFAGGLDSETMCAFEEIRQRVPMHTGGSRELLAGIASS